jgi:Family of unknown function (DUF6527)
MNVLKATSNGMLLFRCPGCKSTHGVSVDSEEFKNWTKQVSYGAHAKRPAWGWNGDMVKPTFSPSILVTYPANLNASEEFSEWRTDRVCHSFITDGNIQFLGDCTHELANQIVPLPEWRRRSAE